MSRGINWRAVADQRRMRRQGVEDVKAAPPFMAPLLKKPTNRRPPTKAEERKQAAAAFAAWRERHGEK
jgi:hypothetical protein